MPRPMIKRVVKCKPEVRLFLPDKEEYEEVILTLDELEAIRLKDTVCKKQENCASRMGVSRKTFYRILKSGRKKIADALVNGKAIRIEGGEYIECLE